MSPVIDTRELYSMPANRKFNPLELNVIREELKKERSGYVIKYAFYRKHSSKGAYVAFIIDQSANAVRKSGVENNWEVFSKRPISDIEFEEMVENYGCNIQRFKVWYYRDIEALIQDDLKYNIITPERFVDECRKRGYSGSFQTEFNFC